MKIDKILCSFVPAAKRTGLMIALGGTLLAAPMLAQHPTDNSNNTSTEMTPKGETGGMHGRDRMRMEHMKKELNLSDDQASQIQQIHQQNMQQMQSLHQDTTLSKEDRHSRMMDLRKAEHEQVRAVLNDEQKEKFDKMVKKHEEKHEKRDHKPEIPDAQAAPPAM